MSVYATEARWERDMQCCVEAERLKAFVLAHFLYQGNDG